jgi:hypothetical protein
MTYEYTVILAPAVIASLWLLETDRRWRIATSVAVVSGALLEIVVSASLHSRLPTPRPADYVLNLKVGPLFTATAKQLVSAIPLSEYWIPGPQRPHLDISALAVVAGLVLGGMVVTGLIREWRTSTPMPTRSVVLVGLIGGWMWFAPALLAGATLRWQIVDVWGQGYVPVVFETVGFALVVVAALEGLKRRLLGHTTSLAWPNIVAVCLLGVIGVALAITAAANYLMIFPVHAT